MHTFTGYEYLLIDAANQFGLDKENFNTRIEWVKENIDDLELLGEAREDKWKESPLYFKAVMAIRDAQEGEPIGHMVGFDAVCSGMQIMSAITGCYNGASATGLVDPNRRVDAYLECMNEMRKSIPTLPDTERVKVKQAVMTVLYGSKHEPMKLFGEGSEELGVFYKSMQTIAPGACELLADLLSTWQPYALEHSWVMPDNHHVHVKVMETIEKRVEIDEMNHTTFTYRYQENVGSKKGLSNVANVIHSIDGYILRSLIRRCSYDVGNLMALKDAIQDELVTARMTHTDVYTPLQIMRDNGLVDSTFLGLTDFKVLQQMNNAELKTLLNMVDNSLVHPSFDVITVHDDFKCHPNNMNQLRFHYKEILADLADSDIVSSIASDIVGKAVIFTKLSSDLSKYIRNSNYALS